MIRPRFEVDVAEVQLLMYRSFLKEAMLDFWLVRLHAAIWGLTKDFPVRSFHKFLQTTSKSKFKDWPKKNLFYTSMFFSIFRKQKWSFWLWADERLNFCCLPVSSRHTTCGNSIFWSEGSIFGKYSWYSDGSWWIFQNRNKFLTIS